MVAHIPSRMATATKYPSLSMLAPLFLPWLKVKMLHKIFESRSRTRSSSPYGSRNDPRVNGRSSSPRRSADDQSMGCRIRGDS
ncbi:hypothetical protein Y032_0582g291 [Ancylostoma ceylanicum]|uniref:Uncharacterized protein n=1 Tax=Ancylostoma ceylanicum TaxID=53326 RepID=A0A016WQ28_9BILA|nr:hypothetical protein Y032_0582g291 [Ancylostoma ceylanicum]